VNATDAENSRTYIDGINFGTPGNYQNGTLKYRMIDNLMIDGYFAADTVRFDDTASGVRGSFYAANPNGFCFMAVYDGNKLVDLVMGEYAGLEGTAYKYTAETASGSDLVNGYKVKAFLWDGFNGIKPLDEKTVQGYIVQ
jgi:hypothetical protein